MLGKHRASAEQALLFLGSIQERLTIVSIDAEEYVAALQTSATLGIIGGAIYDAIFAHCAIKAEADAIYTWNVRRYSLCGPDVTRRLQTP
jgi:predicted nucleic acid-binding protein